MFCVFVGVRASGRQFLLMIAVTSESRLIFHCGVFGRLVLPRADVKRVVVAAGSVDHHPDVKFS